MVFKKLKVMLSGVGICHQVNIEYLSKVVWREQKQDLNLIHPDTCIGTDSHTPMVNAIGVLVGELVALKLKFLC